MEMIGAINGGEDADRSGEDADKGETHHPTVVLKNTSQTLNCSPEEGGEETNTSEHSHIPSRTVHVTTPHTLLFNITHKGDNNFRFSWKIFLEMLVGNFVVRNFVVHITNILGNDRQFWQTSERNKTTSPENLVAHAYTH